MKFSTFLKVILLATVLLQSCTDLQPTVYSNLTTANAYNSENDIEAALTGVYARMDPFPGDSYLYYSGYLVMITDYTTDMGLSTAAGDPTEMSNMTYDAANRYLKLNWSNMYQLISNANRLLSEIDHVKIEEEKKKNIIAQTRFLRGLAYYDLRNAWGPVPMITKPVENPAGVSDIPLAPVERVDSLIISDCKYAIDHLPVEWAPGTGLSRATKGAALTLCGKVYMRSHDYQKAKKYIDQVLELRRQGVYTLNPDFKNVWSGSNKIDQGMIFGILHNAVNDGAEIVNHFGPQDHPIVENRWQYYGVSLYFWRKYGKKDPRKKFFYYNYEGADDRGPNTDQGFWYMIPKPGQTNPADTVIFMENVATKKYSYQMVNSGYLDGRTIIIYRLADVILLKAEIANALRGPGAALQYVNRIRARAGAPLYGEPGFPIPDTKAEMDSAILLERGLELVFEYKRREDLIRFGKWVEYTNRYLKSRGLEPVANKDMIYLPYPLSAARQNSRMQTLNASRVPN